MASGGILALDASTKVVGWCLADYNGYVASGVQRFDAHSGTVWDRLAAICRWTQYMLLKYHPAVLVVEEPTGSHGNPRTDRLLGAVLGVVCAASLEARPVPRFALVTASQVRATGYHKKTPRDTSLFVGETITSPDQLDAVGVWQAFLRKERDGSD